MSYTLREVAAMLGISPTTIRAYAGRGFLEPERGTRGELRFGFQDLVILRTAGELTAARIPQRKVRRVLRDLREQLPPGRSLTAVRISAEGDRVLVRDGDTVWNPESRQVLFDFAVSELADRAAPFALRAAAEARGREHELTAQEWYELACDLEITSPKEAELAYKTALRLDPRQADAHVNLGRLLHEYGTPAAAEKHYRRALELDPGHEIASFNLGVALEDLGRLTDAAAAYRAAIAIEPDNADAHYNLAGVLERRGDKPGALRHLKAYRKLM
jgi:tetratricopeptide (TPR) repeat protein